MDDRTRSLRRRTNRLSSRHIRSSGRSRRLERDISEFREQQHSHRQRSRHQRVGVDLRRGNVSNRRDEHPPTNRSSRNSRVNRRVGIDVRDLHLRQSRSGRLSSTKRVKSESLSVSRSRSPRRRYSQSSSRSFSYSRSRSRSYSSSSGISNNSRNSQCSCDSCYEQKLARSSRGHHVSSRWPTNYPAQGCQPPLMPGRPIQINPYPGHPPINLLGVGHFGRSSVPISRIFPAPDIYGDRTNLMVNYLPTSMSEEKLTDMFSPYGTIEQLKIVRDRTTQASRGYGFVQYGDRENAHQALRALDGIHLDGKFLKVSFAKSKAAMQQLSGHFAANQVANLYISGLPITFDVPMLHQLFEPYGIIVDSKILYDHVGTSRGVAFIAFSSLESAYSAIRSLHKAHIPGGNEHIVVRFSEGRGAFSGTNNPRGISRLPPPVLGGPVAPTIPLLPPAGSFDAYLASHQIDMSRTDSKKFNQTIKSSSGENHVSIKPDENEKDSNDPTINDDTNIKKRPPEVSTDKLFDQYNDCDQLNVINLQKDRVIVSKTVKKETSSERQDIGSDSPRNNDRNLPQNTIVEEPKVSGILDSNESELAVVLKKENAELKEDHQFNFTEVASDRQFDSLSVKPKEENINLHSRSRSQLRSESGSHTPTYSTDNNNQAILKRSKSRESAVKSENEAQSNISIPTGGSQIPIIDGTNDELNPFTQFPSHQMQTQTHQKQTFLGHCVFVFHLPNYTTESEVLEMFAKYGKITSVKVAVEMASGRSKGYGFVNFENRAEAVAAISGLNGHQIGRKFLKVSFKKQPLFF